MPHDHDHPHDHSGSADPATAHRHPPLRPDQDDTITYWRAMEIAVRGLLIEKGVVSADEVRRAVEDMDNRTALQGARIVAKAWTDPEYRKLLLSDGNAACEALGIDGGTYKLVVVENTDAVHNVIVCTLCSCYPRWLLGLPPDWYKSRNYRSRVINEPRDVLREFGTEIPGAAVVRVHDSTADMRYLVLPKRPAGTDGWPEDKLAALVTRDSMIGVAFAAPP
ncbi:MAG TPA: nitrile hydratase subunit alpha [Burkholderiales bacterium]|nr:nitrile hydratase subunit alpha [Burkholderiales bacterium]